MYVHNHSKIGRISDAHSWPNSIGAAYFLPNTENFSDFLRNDSYGSQFQRKQTPFDDIASFHPPPPSSSPPSSPSDPDISLSWVVFDTVAPVDKAKTNLVRSLQILADGKDDTLVRLAPLSLLFRSIILGYLVEVNNLIAISSTGVRGMKYSRHALLGHFIPIQIQSPSGTHSVVILEKYLSTQGYVVALNYDGEDLLVDLSAYRKSWFVWRDKIERRKVRGERRRREERVQEDWIVDGETPFLCAK